MPRKITVSIAFDFYPDTDDYELFKGENPDYQIVMARKMARNDILTLAENNDLYSALWVETEGEAD